ncbi:MAG: hypothetical protein RIA69_16815 [Cyclobacteriaceae bacterium]
MKNLPDIASTAEGYNMLRKVNDRLHVLKTSKEKAGFLYMYWEQILALYKS